MFTRGNAGAGEGLLSYWYTFAWTAGTTTLYFSRVGIGIFSDPGNLVPTGIMRPSNYGLSYYVRMPRFLVRTHTVNVMVPLWCMWVAWLMAGVIVWRLTRTQRPVKGFPVEGIRKIATPSNRNTGP